MGPARRARLEADREPGHPGDGALAGQPVVPRHAQRDPAGRHRRRRRHAPRPRSGTSSPTAAWASSPVARTATTPLRPRTSRRRRPRRPGARSPARDRRRHRRARSRARSWPSAATPPASAATTPHDRRPGVYTIRGSSRAPTRRCSRAVRRYDHGRRTRDGRGLERDTLNWSLRARLGGLGGGGATVTASTAPDYTPFGCGPAGADRPVAGRRAGAATRRPTPSRRRRPRSRSRS